MPILRNVEIFKTGTWNDHSYSQTDLDHIVARFGQHPVPLKMNHGVNFADFGQVTALHRDGDTLLADLDVPQDVLREFRLGVYTGLSCELDEDNNLHAVGLVTGPGNRPAVKGLAPISVKHLEETFT